MKRRIILAALFLGLTATVASAQPSPRPGGRQDPPQQHPVGPGVQPGQVHTGSNSTKGPLVGQQQPQFTQRQQRYDWRNYQPGRRLSNWDRNLDRRLWEGNVRADRSYR